MCRLLQRVPVRRLCLRGASGLLSWAWVPCALICVSENGCLHAQLSKQWRWQHNDNNNSNRLAFRKRVLTTVLRPNQTNVPFVSDSPWVDLLSYWISSGRSYLKGFWMDPWGLPLEGRTRPSTKRCSVSAFLVKCQRKKQKSLQGKL